MLVCHFCSSTVDTRFFADLGKGFASRSLSALWVTPAQESPPAWMNHLEGSRYFCLGVGGRSYFPLAVTRLAALLRRERVDILQTHLFEGGIIGILAAYLAGTPLVIVTRHHLDQVHLIGNRLHIGLDRWMARRANRVVVLSNAVRNYMIEADHIDGDKVEVIYQGFDFERLCASDEDRQRVRSEFKLDGKFVVGCIGQLFGTKGQDHLMNALKLVAEEMPAAHLFFVGGGDQKPFEEIARELGLQDRVTFAGFRKDVPSCMAAMDMVVHPSLSEAFCQVLIESLAMAKPLIATDVGGAVEVITEGETGMLIPPANPGAIAKAMLDLYRAPELRQRLGLAGQASVRQRFPVSLMVDRHVRCYSDWLHTIDGSGERESLSTRS